MRLFLPAMKPLLIALALLAPWNAAQALEKFQQVGTIASIDSSTVRLTGDISNYRLRSSIDIKKPDADNATAGDFSAGNTVYLKGNILNGVYYVDSMIQIPNSDGQL
ncbi:MAG: hypothetical protein ACI9LO_001191 [Planctomycetota bacterium]|jgi:hypothetical protein